MRRLEIFLLSCIILVLGSSCTKAQYVIPDSSSIEGVKIGDYIGEVRKKLSKRFICQKSTIELEGEKCPVLLIKDKDGKKLFILEEYEKKVWRIQIISPRYKTKEGIHIGSTLAEAIKVYGQPSILEGEGTFATFKNQQHLSFNLKYDYYKIDLDNTNYNKYANEITVEYILIVDTQ